MDSAPADKPIATTTRQIRRPVLMPRGGTKTSTMRTKAVTLACVRWAGDKPND